MEKSILKKATEYYIRANVQELAESIVELKTEDLELVFIHSIINKKLNQLRRLLENEVELQSINASVEIDGERHEISFKVTVYFDKIKYDYPYNNHSFDDVDIEKLSQKIISYLNKNATK